MEEKEKMGKIKNKLFYLIIALLIVSMVLVGGEIVKSKSKIQLGNLSINNLSTDFVITKFDGYEKSNFDIEINKDKNKEEICLLVKPTSTHSADIDFSIKDKNNNEKEKIKVKKTDNKYCISYKNKFNKDDYLKIGNSTIIIIYQNIKRIEYNTEWSNSNITLYKFDNNSYSNINDVWVFTKNNSYKFGAVDNNTYLNNFKYVLTSDVPLQKDVYSYYIEKKSFLDMFNNNVERHYFNFQDICNRKFNCVIKNYTIGNITNNYSECISANCNFNLINPYNLEVTFISDKDIDPTLTLAGDTSYNATLTNVTQEIGYAHLNLSDDTIKLYMPFDSDSGNNTRDYSPFDNDGTCGLTGIGSCPGTHNLCSTYGDSATCESHGCTPLTSCGGTHDACTTYTGSGQGTCESHTCTWDAYNAAYCSGNLDCSIYGDGDCQTRSQCTWGAQCDNLGSCGGVGDEGTCINHNGCSWIPEDPEDCYDGGAQPHACQQSECDAITDGCSNTYSSCGGTEHLCSTWDADSATCNSHGEGCGPWAVNGSGICPSFTTGKYGRGYQFDISDFISFPYSSSLNTTNNDTTISLWVKSSESLTNHNLISYSENDVLEPNVDWYIMFKDNITIGGIGDASERTTNVSLTDGNWHLLTLTKNSSQYTVYKDGVKQLEQAIANNHAAFTTSHILNIGDNLNVNSYSGSIDEVMIYNRTLNSTEVSDLYNAQSTRFLKTGNMLFTNLNFAGNTTNLTVNNCTTLQNTNLSAKINTGSVVNFTNCVILNYSIPSPIDNANLTIFFSSDQYGFYSPTAFGNISLNYTDNIAPTLTIISPVNNSNFNISNVTFNATSNENLSWCGLSIDSGANVTMTLYSTLAGANFTNSTMSNLNHTFLISCNDTSGNIGNSGLNYVLTDTIYPDVNFTGQTPVNASTQSATSVFVNVSSNDTLGQHSVVMDWNNSLVFWMRMDDVNSSGDPIEYFGRANASKGTGNSQIDNGKRGKAFSINYTGGAMTVKNANLINPAQNFTVMLWAVSNALGTTRALIDKRGGSSTGYDLITSGNWRVFNSSGSSVNVGAGITSNVWLFLTLTYNGTNAVSYKNGVRQVISNISGNINGTANLLIGSLTGGGNMNGTIDDVQIYNRVLSAQEINASFNANLYKYTNNFTSLADGNYTFKAYAQDLGGNVNATETRSVTIDSALPNGTWYNITNNSFFNYNKNYSVNATDNFGIKNISLYINGILNETFTFASGITNTITGVVKILTDGVYTLYWKIYDWASNLFTTETYTVTIDKTNPTWSSNKTNLTSATSLSQSVYFNITLNDTNPSKYIFGWYNGTEWINDSQQTYTNQEIQIIKQINIDIGNINWTWYFNDSAGNSNQTTEFSITLIADDNIPPNITLISPSNNSYLNNRTVYFIANYTDNVALKNTTLYVWNSTNSTVNTTSQNITGTSNSTNISVVLPYDGTFLWNYYACDNNNNCGWNNTNSTFTIDTTFPIVNITYPVNGIGLSNYIYILNYTVNNSNLSSSNLSKCWYSNDFGVNNYSIHNYNIGYFNISTLDNDNNFIVYCNTTHNNIGTSNVTFTISRPRGGGGTGNPDNYFKQNYSEICEASYYFITKHIIQNGSLNYSEEDVDNLVFTTSERMNIWMDKSILIRYIENYDELCNESKPIPKPLSIIPIFDIDINNPNYYPQVCSTSAGYGIFDLPLPPWDWNGIMAGNMSCSNLQTLRWFLKYEKLDGQYVWLGIRAYWIAIIGIIIFIILIVKAINKR